jgi:hypothetical protein
VLLVATTLAHTTMLTEIAIAIVLHHLQLSNTAMALMPAPNF